MCPVEQADLKRQRWYEKADVGGLDATRGQGNVWAWAAAKGCIWVDDPAAAVVSASTWLLLPPKAMRMPRVMLVPDGHAATRAILI